MKMNLDTQEQEEIFLGYDTVSAEHAMPVKCKVAVGA